MGCGSIKRDPEVTPLILVQKRTEPGVFLVRSAGSVYDYWKKKYSEEARREKTPDPESDPDYKYLEELRVKWELKLIDPSLHKSGIKKAKELANSYNTMNIKHVFVSPLKRSLESCRFVLQSHPNRANIKIFVHPLLRPFLNNPEDIPNKTMSELKKEYESIPDLKFDFSLLEKENGLDDLYFLNNLNSPEKEELLEEAIKHKDAYAQVVMDYMFKKRTNDLKETRYVETFDNMRRRAVQFCEFLKRYIELAGMKPEEDLVIFTHGPVLIYLMALYWGPDGRALGLKSNRCEPVLFNYQRLLNFETQFRSARAIRTQLTVKLMPGEVSSEIAKAEITIIPLITCAKGHQLFFSRFAEVTPAYECVKCLKGCKCEEGRWNCLFCKYNLCPGCKSAPTPEKLKKLCVNGHTLEETEVGEDLSEGFICSRCKKEGISPKESKRFCCVACSYDVCPNCI